jgi:hypothetical protein
MEVLSSQPFGSWATTTTAAGFTLTLHCDSLLCVRYEAEYQLGETVVKPSSTKAPMVSFKSRKIESRAVRWSLFLARIVVALASLLFFLVAVMVIKVGIRDGSWGLAAVGALLVVGALGLIWAGFTSKGKDVCEAAIILLIR